MEKIGFHFKKQFGQNFLKDDNIIKNICNTAEILPNSLVIEVGPGAGALTKKLCPLAKYVLAYEIDTRLEETLDEELHEFNNVTIIYEDFLKRNIKEDIEKYDVDNIYVVANLPYYITTPIITKLIDEQIPLKKIVVMVQKEVGDRFAAKPNSKEYNSLTVFLNYYFDIKKAFIVSKNCFIPKPNVDSIVVSLISKKEKHNLLNQELFFSLVRDSFKFKRKNLRNNLKAYDLKLLEEVLNTLDLDLNARAEQLSLEDFVTIANYLEEHRSTK